MPWRWRNSLVKIFDHSSRAASRVGPKTRRPSAWKRSTRPAASASSGPTTVRSIRFSAREGEQAVHVGDGERDVLAELGGAGVARRAVDFLDRAASGRVSRPARVRVRRRR